MPKYTVINKCTAPVVGKYSKGGVKKSLLPDTALKKWTLNPGDTGAVTNDDDLVTFVAKWPTTGIKGHVKSKRGDDSLTRWQGLDLEVRIAGSTNSIPPQLTVLGAGGLG
jgi:hypothetical protein